MIVIILMILLGIRNPKYLRIASLTVKLKSWMPLLFASFGQTFVILTGGIDLSQGTMIALVNVIVVQLVMYFEGSMLGIIIAVSVGLLVGTAAGIINGLILTRLRLQALITTYATGVIWRGLALAVMGEPGGQVPMSFYHFFSGKFLYIPVAVYLLGFSILLYVFLLKRGTVTELKAVGGSTMAAFESGVNVNSKKVMAYGICGFFTSLATLAIIGETISGSPLAGTGYELEAISSAAIGGASLSGGFGSPIGSLFGGVITRLINDVIFFYGIDVKYQQLMQGVIIILALSFGSLLARSLSRRDK
ncbi:ABC transporter permease [Oceanispirochaeta sp. M1]|nr:ABC transporter permease [Oceanispirochaeta sp. M1]